MFNDLHFNSAFLAPYLQSALRFTHQWVADAMQGADYPHWKQGQTWIWTTGSIFGQPTTPPEPKSPTSLQSIIKQKDSEFCVSQKFETHLLWVR